MTFLVLLLPIFLKCIMGAQSVCSGSVFTFFSLTESLNYAAFCAGQDMTILTSGLASTNLAYLALSGDVLFCSSNGVTSAAQAYFASLNPATCVYYSENFDSTYTTPCSVTVPWVACIGRPPAAYTTSTETSIFTTFTTTTVVTTTTQTVLFFSTVFVYTDTQTVRITSAETVTSISLSTTSTLTTLFTTTTDARNITSTDIQTTTISFLDVSSSTTTQSFTETSLSTETAIFMTTISTTTTTSSCPFTRTSVVIVPTSTTITVTSYAIATVTELVPVATTSNCNIDDDE